MVIGVHVKNPKANLYEGHSRSTCVNLKDATSVIVHFLNVNRVSVIGRVYGFEKAMDLEVIGER